MDDPVEGTDPVEEDGPWLSPGDVLEIRVDLVEGISPVRKATLKGESVIAMEGPEAMEEVLETVRSGKEIREAPKEAKKSKPERPDTSAEARDFPEGGR